MENHMECKIEINMFPYRYNYVHPDSHVTCSGEYWHEPSGKLYKGSFKKGLFHGHGELLWFTDKEDKKKYIGEFTKGVMDGRGEMKWVELLCLLII